MSNILYPDNMWASFFCIYYILQNKNHSWCVHNHPVILQVLSCTLSFTGPYNYILYLQSIPLNREWIFLFNNTVKQYYLRLVFNLCTGFCAPLQIYASLSRVYIAPQGRLYLLHFVPCHLDGYARFPAKVGPQESTLWSNYPCIIN